MNEKQEQLEDFSKVWGISQSELDEIREQAREKLRTTKHNWKQKGVELYCNSCDTPHGIYIGTKKILVGITKDGTPILVNKGEAR